MTDLVHSPQPPVDLVGDRTIEELPIPYTAVASDIENEKEVWINSGRLFGA